MIPCLFYQAMSKIFVIKNIDLVNTYFFYQVSKVYDIVFLDFSNFLNTIYNLMYKLY